MYDYTTVIDIYWDEQIPTEHKRQMLTDIYQHLRTSETFQDTVLAYEVLDLIEGL